jgi:DNA-binding CsgD family transcriptional regulator/tetratricopeptide (TPR) repeat protein
MVQRLPYCVAALRTTGCGPVLSSLHEDRWVAWARRALDAVDRKPLGRRDVIARPANLDAPAVLNDAVARMVTARWMHHRAEYSRANRALARARGKLRRMAREGDARAVWLIAWCRLWETHAVYETGRFADALRQYGSASRTMASFGDARGLAVSFRGLGNACKFLGLYAEAVEHYGQSITHSRACDDHAGLAATEHNQGNVLLALGDVPGAEAAYRRSLQTSRRAGRRDLHHHCWVSLAATAQSVGNAREALRRLTCAARSSQYAGPGFEAERFVAIGVAEAALHHEAKAAAALERAQVLAAAAGETHIEALALEALAAFHLQHGRTRDAKTCAERGLKLTSRAGASTELAGTLHQLAASAARQDGDWRRAVRHYEAALREQQRLTAQRQIQHVRSQALLAELRALREEAERARGEIGRLKQALTEVAARLHNHEAGSGASVLEGVSAASLRRLGLSPRASEVLHWVVQGKTNEEIAIILGCGAETVKTHLKHVYLQLDVTNRAAAAVRAVEFTASAARMAN